MNRIAVAFVCSTLAVPVSAAVTGRVVGADGAAVPKASVALYRPVPPQFVLAATGAEALAKGASDAEGRFSLDPSSRGVVMLHVEAEGHAPSNTFVASDEDVGTITLRAATLAKGRVTAGGKPVADATVLVFPQIGVPLVTRTSAEGIYRVPEPSSWAQTVVVKHPEYAPAWHMAASLDFALDAGRPIKGTVVDERRRPVAGATVDINQLITTRTNGDGAFVIAHAPRDAAMITVRSADAKTVAMLTSPTPALVARKTVRISGVVRDAEGRPVSGVYMMAASEGTQPRADQVISYDVAVTDAKGAYALDVLSGKHSVTAEAASIYEAEPVSVDATSKGAVLDVVVQRRRAIEGIVRDEAGKPVAGAAISVMQVMDANNSVLGQTGSTSDDDGKFRLRVELQPEMKIQLVAIKNGLPPAISTPLTEGSKTPVVITIPKGFSIAGVVVGPDEKPLAGVRVNPVVTVQAYPSDDAWATTNAEGRFSGAVTAATKSLSFARTGYLPNAIAIDEQQGVQPLHVTLEQAGALTGRVVTAEGTPVAEAIVVIGHNVSVTTGADGSFVIEGLEPGVQVVRFGRTMFHQQTVNVPASDVKLIMPATRTVRGRVVNTSGTPIAAFAVRAGGEGVAVDVPVQSSNGDFEVEVPVSDPRLSVSAEGYIRAKDVPVDVASAKPIVVTLSRGRTLRGRVTDDKNQPLSGVLVSVSGAYEFGSPQSRDDGTYEASGLSHDEPIRVTFAREGFVSADRKIAQGGDDVSLDIALSRGLSISGRVLDSAGAGVPNVAVYATSAAHGSASSSAQTDDSGAFHFSVVPARYDFAVHGATDGRRGGLKDVDVEKVREITIRLEKRPTATIFGRVTGLELSPAGTSYVSSANAEGDSAQGQIDRSGNYRIESAPTGTVSVQASVFSDRRMRSSKSATADAAPGSETRVDLIFEPQIKLTGRVLRGGTPLPGSTIQFSYRETALTTPEGTYQISLEPGNYDVAITMADGRKLPFSQKLVVTRAAEVDFSVDSATIAVRALDATTGQPLAGVSVSASPVGNGHSSIGEVTTGVDGNAVIEVMSGAKLTLRAAKTGYANLSEDVLPSQNQSVVVRLVRTPGAVVRLVDQRDGRTLTGYVIARDASGRLVASVSETDPDGTFILPIAPGRYTFSASAEGFGSVTRHADVPGSEVRLALPRGGSLSLRSEHNARGTARLIQSDGSEYVRCVCNGIAEITIDGSATLVDRIAPGSYTLEVTLADGKTKRVPVAVMEGQVTAVAID